MVMFLKLKLLAAGMKIRYITLSFALAILTSAISALAHGEGIKKTPWQQLGIPNPNQMVILAGIIIAAAIIVGLIFRDKLKENQKKVIFLVIAIPAILGTLYLAGTTVYLNQKSWSRGPVHWHADFEIWVCGEQVDLTDPKGLRNYVGESDVHEHGDNRIHIEGVMFEKEDATLKEFFEALGGEFSRDVLRVPTEHDYKAWSNGEMCNGQPAEWHTFVNEKLRESKEAPEYVISPWQTVPPGDTIKFVFSEKNAEEINSKLGAPP